MGVKILTMAEVHRTYGNPHYTVNGDTTLNLDANWVAENIVTVFIPQLKGVSTGFGGFSGKVRWNKKGVQQLQRFWQEVEDQGHRKDVLTWSGSVHYHVRLFVPGFSANRSTRH